MHFGVEDVLLDEGRIVADALCVHEDRTDKLRDRRAHPRTQQLHLHRGGRHKRGESITDKEWLQKVLSTPFANPVATLSGRVGGIIDGHLHQNKGHGE